MFFISAQVVFSFSCIFYPCNHVLQNRKNAISQKCLIDFNEIYSAATNWPSGPYNHIGVALKCRPLKSPSWRMAVILKIEILLAICLRWLLSFFTVSQGGVAKGVYGAIPISPTSVSRALKNHWIYLTFIHSDKIAAVLLR